MREGDLKTIHTRIQLKNDTEANWNNAVNFYPRNGEVIIYDTDENHNRPRFKVGDGVTVLGELPFVEREFSVSDNVLTIN